MSRQDCCLLKQWYKSQKTALEGPELLNISKLILTEIIRHNYINVVERGEILAESVSDIIHYYEDSLKSHSQQMTKLKDTYNVKMMEARQILEQKNEQNL